MDLNNHIAKIQENAAKLTNAKDGQEIYSLLKSIESEVRNAEKSESLAEFDRLYFAEFAFNHFFKGMTVVPLSRIATLHSNSPHYLHTLRSYSRAGLLPVIRKHKKVFATPETLAEWYQITDKARSAAKA